MTDDDENQQLDYEIVDQDRQAQLPDLADAVLSELDWERQAEAQRAEEQLERQMADLERELWEENSF